MTSQHAAQRIRERLSEPEVRALVPRIQQALVRGQNASVAFKSEPFDFHGTPWSDDSNGDTLVVVVRFGTLVTLMWRRSTQPFTPEKFRVDAVEAL